MPFLRENAQSLERQVRTLRSLQGDLLGLDAYDRWSHDAPEQKDAAQREAAEKDAAFRALKQQLETQVAALRKSDPAAVSAWAEAHITLLTAFIAEAQKEADKNRTEIFVANGEIAAWKTVISGKKNFIEQNIFYVHYSPELYAQLFRLD